MKENKKIEKRNIKQKENWLRVRKENSKKWKWKWALKKDGIEIIKEIINIKIISKIIKK